MKYAIIDIGTNSILTLIAEFDGNNFKVISDNADFARLGEGALQDGIIKKIPLQRTISVLKKSIRSVLKQKVDELYLIGTAIFRKANNQKEILEQIELETGYEINIISGEEEAELSYLSAADNSNESILVVDIGGGSTEIITGKGDIFDYCQSLHLGAVELKERFLRTDPPQKDELEKMHNYIRLKLAERSFISGFERCIGIGGTITTLGAVLKKMVVYDPEKIEGMKLELHTLEDIYIKICGMTNPEIIKLPGMEPERADIIVPGTAILLGIYEKFNINTAYISTKGIRYGYLKKLLRKM